MFEPRGHDIMSGSILYPPHNPGEKFIHESYIGSKFTGQIESITQVGKYEANIPSIEGWAKIYGYNTILVDPNDDPYTPGFQVI